MRKLIGGLRALFRQRQTEQEMDEELRGYLDASANEKMHDGMSEAEARRAARVELGSVDAVKEEIRRAGWESILDTIWQDVRYGLRQLRRNPGFTAVAVITLALGLGASTAMFSVVNAVLLRPLPYQDPGRLMVVWTDNIRKNLHTERTSYPNFQDWKKQNRVFEDMAFCSAFTVNLTGDDEPERVVAARVTSNFFSMLGLSPFLGRTFSAEDEALGNRVVVLSYGLWQRRFHMSREVLGQGLEIDGARATVIGVMPAPLQLPASDVQFWEPHSMFPAWAKTKAERRIPSGYVIGRLKPGITLQEAQADMSDVGTGLARQYPTLGRDVDFFGFGVNIIPLAVQTTGRETRVALWLLFGAVGLVLLIACSNVANLQLSRGAGRARELAVRTALGAGRTRLVRQLLTESVVLFAASGLLGVCLSGLISGTMIRLAPQNTPGIEHVRMEPAAISFALGVSLLMGIAFGLTPALKVSHASPRASLQQGGRSLTLNSSLRRWRGILVVSQFALAVVLLVGAHLLLRSLLRLQSVDPGFRPERVLLARVVQSSAKPPAQWAALYPRALEMIRAIPGVEAAGAIDNFFFESHPDDTIVPEDRASSVLDWQAEQVMGDGVSADYFRAAGVPLLRGRFFSDQDGLESLRVAIVNQTLARHFWPGKDPIGQRFKFGFQTPSAPWISVIGVAGDMRREGLDRTPVSQAFLPLTQDPARGMDLVIRTTSDPLKLAPAVRSAVASVDKTAPVINLSTLNEELSAQSAPRRFETTLLTLFAGLALVLAAIGIYGLMHYSLAQRTHEIGVRMALGAARRDVIRMVLGQGLRLALIGMSIGIPVALALTRFLSSLLYDVSRNDPVTYFTVSLVLLTVALLACYVPARRATKVDPLVALRYE